ARFETSTSSLAGPVAPPTWVAAAARAARASAAAARARTVLAGLRGERGRGVEAGAERDLEQDASLRAGEIAREERARLLEVTPAAAPVDRGDAPGGAARADGDGHASG